MIATINIGAAASQLADREIQEKYKSLNKSKSFTDLATILFTEKDGVLMYKPEIQKEFDDLYDMYEHILLEEKEPDISDLYFTKYKVAYEPNISKNAKDIIVNNIEYSLSAKDKSTFLYNLTDIFKILDKFNDEDKKKLSILKCDDFGYIEF